MPDRFQSQEISCRGGLDKNRDTIQLQQTPGAAIELVNYEPSIFGGYRRISGFTKFDTNALAGTGDVLGTFVFAGSVLGMRGTEIYKSTGSGWGSAIDTGRTSAGKYWATRYNWTGTENIIFCDGANAATRYDDTTMTDLNGTGAPTDPQYVEEFRSRIILAGYSANAGAITISAPSDETVWTAAAGAVELVVGDEIRGLKKFRDTLYIFCKDSIHKLTGATTDDFEVKPITEQLGCFSGWSIQEIGGDLLFLSSDGIRTIAGTERIGDVEVGSISNPITSIMDAIPSDAGTPDNISSLIIRDKSQYRLFYPGDATIESLAKGIVGAIRKNIDGNLAWEWGELEGIKPTCSDSFFQNDTTELVVHGGFDGFVYKQESGTDFNGGNIASRFFTPNLFFDSYDNRKTFYKLTVFFRIEGTTSVATSLVFDFDSADVIQPKQIIFSIEGTVSLFGSAIFGTNVFGAQRFPRVTQNTIGSGRAMQVRFLTDDTNDSHTIQGFNLEFIQHGRR